MKKESGAVLLELPRFLHRCGEREWDIPAGSGSGVLRKGAAGPLRCLFAPQHTQGKHQHSRQAAQPDPVGE